ncbi:MAG: hypothetical protein FJ297_07640 [Planctomycetes bacterium]|nr:hypothetical protein [Planctomycetota bacterium]
MPRPIPDYLRLHMETGEPVSASSDRILSSIPETLAEALGWTIASADDLGGARREGARTGADRWRIVEAVGEAAKCDREAAERVVVAVNELASRLGRSLAALRAREAELAAGVPVSRRTDEEAHLAERLEAILRGGAESVRCQAAGLYLLDEATSQLKLRSAWGLPPTRFADPPRALRGALADLEALLGNAVVLDDIPRLGQWKSPEDRAAAVCVPVSTPTTPLGTMWVFSDTQRGFDGHETQLLEIVAGRIASELEREMLLNEAVSASQWSRQVVRLAERQQQRLPSFPPLVDGWDLASWSSPSGTLAAEFHDWGVCRDGRVFVAAGRADGAPLDAAWSMASVQAALASRIPSGGEPGDVIESVNESLWRHSVGDPVASLFLAFLEPNRGGVAYAHAGDPVACVVGRSSVRFLTPPAIGMGANPEAPFASHSVRLARREALVVIGSPRACDARDIDVERAVEPLGAVLGALPPDAPARSWVDQTRSHLLARHAARSLPEFTVLVARRR